MVLGGQTENLVNDVQDRLLGGEVGAHLGAAGRVHVEDAAFARHVEYDGDVELTSFTGPVDDIADGVGAFVGVLEAATPFPRPRRRFWWLRKEVDLFHSGSPDESSAAGAVILQ